MNKPVDVLVVDDEVGMRLTLKGILTRKGYNVTVAENGAQALEAVNKNSFRVILMDIKMPGMSGVETFVQIKKVDPKATVIMMTGFALEGEIKRAIREGAYAVLSKPLEMQKVLDLIQGSLEHETLVMVLDALIQDKDQFQKMFEARGYKVVQVKKAEDCFQQIKDRKFQVIILDANSAGVKNLDLLRNLKEIQPQVGVIMLTGHSREEWVEEAMKESSFALLYKPVDVEKLLDVVDQQLKGELN